MDTVKYDKRGREFIGQYKAAFLSMRMNSSHDLIDAIESFVKDNARDISSSQLRGIFSQVKVSTPEKIPILRAKLAYVKGRTETRKIGMHTLLDLFNDLMKEIKPNDATADNKLDSFKDFFEAILSFHKLHGSD